MHITIKPLTPNLAADFFDFFDNRAFTDDSPYRCYCQVYQMCKKEYQSAYDNIMQDPGSASRKVAERQIADGILRGYLAYVDGKSIGWCNANDRANYPTEPYCDDVPFHAPVKAQEKRSSVLKSLRNTVEKVSPPLFYIRSSPTQEPKAILPWSDSPS